MTTAKMETMRKRTEAQEPEWSALLSERGKSCLSIYASPNFAWEERELARLESMVAEAGAKSGVPPAELQAVRERIKREWPAIAAEWSPRDTQQGVAMFVAPDFFAAYHLPLAMEDHVVVGREFFVRPLLAALQPASRFFILALSQKYVRLYDCWQFGIREVKLHSVPDLVNNDMAAHAFGEQRQFHSAAPAAEGKKGSVVYGVEPDPKIRIRHFFHDINGLLKNLLRDQQAPLVVATVDYLFPLFQGANTYPNLLLEHLSGNPDHLSEELLHQAAWVVAGKHFQKKQESAFQIYRERINTNSTSSNLRKVLIAAGRGQVRFLFVPQTGEHWGRFAPPEEVHLHAKPEPGDQELLNLTAVLAMRNGGHVYAIPAEQLPEGAEVAAVLRF